MTIADQLITRAKLSADYRIRKAYGGSLATAYAHARSADPQGLLLDKADDIQAEIDRVCALYQTPRRFVTVKVKWAYYQLGQIVTLTYPRYGLEAGQQCLVVGRKRDLTNRTVTLTLWY